MRLAGFTVGGTGERDAHAPFAEVREHAAVRSRPRMEPRSSDGRRICVMIFLQITSGLTVLPKRENTKQRAAIIRARPSVTGLNAPSVALLVTHMVSPSGPQ
jgi:hypothetical protein